MDIKQQRDGDVVIVRLSGRLDSSAALSAEEGLTAALTGAPPRLAIDMSDLAYISSAGLRVLLVLAKKVQQQKGKVALGGLVANVRETDAPAMHVGQPIEVKVLAYPDRIFKARLAYVGAVVDDTTRRVTVRAEVENADGALKPEMFASLAITTSADSEAPAVPQEAVIYEGDSARVWLLLTGNDVGLRRIRVGRQRDGKVEVLEGVSAGQRVVTRGALFIDQATAPAPS